jgi:thiosulfate/3-mercaptopyruvate sulfurtransferase
VDHPLISAQALASELNASAASPALLDVRWELATGPGRDEYRTGHIPGASFVDLDAELAGPPGAGGRHPLPDPELFAAAMRTAGVTNDGPVVVYDAATSIAAARAWWLLRYFGHPHVAVLDGGLAAWVAAGQPLQPGFAQVAPGDFLARAGAMPLLDARSAEALARRGVLLDARAAERYRGEREPIDPIAGHIPGAINRPTADNVDPAGRFLAPADLRCGFERLGVADGVEVGAYCGSGVSAAQEILALELAGFPAAMYAGSWSEWITDRARPVERDPTSEVSR